jgi:serine/threonine protein kinase/WD40 repeat protein
MIPETIGRYQVISMIGRGGMSIVYAAKDPPPMDREVAVKVLPRELLHDATFRARFEREARTVAALEHPRIVPVYDFGETQDGQPFLVMRLLTGGSLAQRLKEGPIALPEAVRILTLIADGLDDAHSQGIIHRDLKPGNILFDNTGEPYITDFGLAKLSEASATLTGNVIVGTPAYMSPEQGRGEKDLDGRSDIYSLGVVFFEMLTGRIPYEADTTMALIIKHISAPIPNVLEYRANLPPDCQILINRSLSKRKEGRFSTAGEFAQAALAVLNGQSVPPPSPLPPWLAARKTASPEPATLVGEEKETRKIPLQAKKPNSFFRVAFILLLLTLIAATGVGVFTYNQGLWNFPMDRTALLSSPSPNSPPLGSPMTTITTAFTNTPMPSQTPTRFSNVQGSPTPAQTEALAPTATLIPAFPMTTFDESYLLPSALTDETIQAAHKFAVLGQGILSDIEFSPDGAVIAAAATTGIYLYDPLTFELVGVLPSQNPVLDLAFANSGDLLASAESDSAVIWDWQARKRLWTLFGPAQEFIDYVQFSPSGDYLIAGSTAALIWDAHSADLVRVFQGVTAAGVSISTDSTVAAVPYERNVQMIHLQNGTIEHEFRIYDVIQTAFVLNGRLLLAATRNIVNLYQLETRELYGSIGGKDLVISKDAYNLVVDNDRGLVQVWRLNDFAMPQFPLRYYPYNPFEYTIEFEVSHNGGVLALWNTSDIVYRQAFSPDFITLYDVVEGIDLGSENLASGRRLLGAVPLPPMFKAIISPADGKTMVTLRDYVVMESWDVTSEDPHRVFNWQSSASMAPFMLQAYTFPRKETQLDSLDQKLRAEVDGDNVVIKRQDGSELRTIAAKLIADPDIAFSPNSELLATTSTGGTIRIWRNSTGQQVCVAGGVGVVARIEDAAKISFSQDSRLLVIHHANTDISFWDSSTCQPIVRYPLNTKLYSPDGSLFLDINPTFIDVRSTDDGSVQKTFYGMFKEPVGFSPDGKYMVAQAIDGTNHLWAIVP